MACRAGWTQEARSAVAVWRTERVVPLPVSSADSPTLSSAKMIEEGRLSPETQPNDVKPTKGALSLARSASQRSPSVLARGLPCAMPKAQGGFHVRPAVPAARVDSPDSDNDGDVARSGAAPERAAATGGMQADGDAEAGSVVLRLLRAVWPSSLLGRFGNAPEGSA